MASFPINRFFFDQVTKSHCPCWSSPPPFFPTRQSDDTLLPRPVLNDQWEAPHHGSGSFYHFKIFMTVRTNTCITPTMKRNKNAKSKKQTNFFFVCHSKRLHSSPVIIFGIVFFTMTFQITVAFVPEGFKFQLSIFIGINRI